MDPLSIASGCAALISTIGTLSLSINTFVRTCREARSDLDRVARELLSLRTVLELIQEDVTDESKTFPKTLGHHVSGIVTNCNLVVIELQDCITKYGGDNRLKTKARWAINGQGDVAKLRSNLEAHKAALELALDMLALHVTREIKNDTTEMRNVTSAIKDDTTQILEEIYRLQARLPKQVENDYVLQHFLEEMTTYTEKALDGASIDGGGSSTRAPSFVIKEEEETDLAYMPDWELDSDASDPEAYRAKKKRWEEQKRQEQLAAEKLAETQPSLESDHKPSFSYQRARQPLPTYIGDYEEHSEAEDDVLLPPDGVSFNEWQETLAKIERDYWAEKEKCREDHERDVYLSEHPLSATASDDYVPEEDDVPACKRTPSEATDTDHPPISRSNETSEQPAVEHFDFKTFYGRLMINWPMPNSIKAPLSEDYYVESSVNTFTPLTCSVQEFPSQKDTLRPKLFPKPRKIRVAFFIPVSTKTVPAAFARQWWFITRAVAGLTRGLGTYEDSPPPWHNIIIIIEGPPRWHGIDPDIYAILTELGILYKTNGLVGKVDDVLLDPPYHQDHCEVFGKMIHATIREYTVPPTLRPRHEWAKNMISAEPLQVIAVAPQALQYETKFSSHNPAAPGNWTAAVCEVLKPEFIFRIRDHELQDVPDPEDFFTSVWNCHTWFSTSKDEQLNRCVLTTPLELKMLARLKVRECARELLGKS
ncbi:hypothetical protein IL306_012705 [Fusarium sp. DS 682]|nr:hypothetical protein IL306_012705 [Fusarium sp. DS 682]